VRRALATIGSAPAATDDTKLCQQCLHFDYAWVGAAGQTACKPGSVLAFRRWMAIPLGRPLPSASRDRPGRRRGNTAAGCPACRPYLVLLPVGFAVPLPLPVARWALTPPFHPCLTSSPNGRTCPAVCSLWHFPWGRPRRPLAGTVSPWSPDFPHQAVARPVQPSGRLT